MATHFERFAEVKNKITSAAIYPLMVCGVGVALVLFFIYFMLPNFMGLFQGFQIELPLPTRILIMVGFVFTHYWWVLLLTGVGILIAFQRFQSGEYGKRRIDEWKMRLPAIGKVMKLNYYGQFARTLSTLLINGVPVLTALKITEQIVPNRIVKQAIARTREEVTDGKTIAQPLARSKLFPQLMIDLIKIGEETGQVPEALKNVADTYENELSIALRVMTNLIEPTMIIIMAIGVGFLLFSVLSAMFAITSSINR